MATRTAALAGVIAILATTLMLVAGGPQAFAGGPPYDGPETAATGPAFFGPAPNPVPYCENPTYFDPFPENINQVGRLDVNAGANEASVTTDGITMNFNITAEGDPGGQYPGFFGDAPVNVDPTDGFAANDQPKGVEMASDDAAVVTLVDQDGNPAPLFYSQWVFTDVDRDNEGFFVTPSYTDPAADNQIAIFAGDEDFTFDGTTSTQAAFNDTDTVGQDSEDIEARVQVDVLGAVTGITMLRDTGSGQSGFAVGGGCEAAGAAKTIVSGPTWNGTSFDVTYELRLRNNLPSAASIGADVLAAQLAAASSISTGTPSGIDLVDVQLEDDLTDAAFSDIAVVDIANPGIAPQGQLPLNPDYNGLDDTDLLLSGAEVDPSTNELIVLQVQYTPDLDTGNWDDCAVGYVYSNQSIVSGSAANVLVQDQSDDGINPDPGVGNGNDGVDDATLVTFPCPPASLQIVKTVVPGPDGTCPAADAGVVGEGQPLGVVDGGTVTYCISVSNPGTSPATGVVVADPQNPDGDEALGTIAGGASSTFSYDLVVTPATETTNVATATGTGPDGALGPVSDPALISVSLQPDPVLSIVKTVVAAGDLCPDYDDGIQGAGPALGVTDGGTVTYCLSVRNTGTGDAVNVEVNDAQAPASFNGVIGSLAAGQTIDLSYTIDVTLATPEVNTAIVSGDGPNGTVPSDSDDALIDISAQLDPALEIVKTVIVGPDGDCPAFADGVAGLGPSLPVLFGDTVTYCISVNNASGSTATNVVITDPMAPADFDGVIGTLAVSDEPVTRSFDLVIGGATPEINTASVNGEGPNGAVPTESDQARIASSPQPDPVLEIVKTVVLGPDGACPAFADGVLGAGASLNATFGETVTYCLSVRNAGLAPATSVVISDPQAPASFNGDIGDLAINAEATRAFDLVVDVTTPQLNTARVEGVGPNGPVPADTDQAVIDPQPPPTPLLDIVKTVIAGPAGNCPAFDDGVRGIGPALPVLYGDTVTYCISVRNTAGTTATDVVIIDAQAPASFDGAIGDLAVGETAEPRSFDLVIDAQTPDINTAQAVGVGPGGPAPLVSDDARIQSSPQPDPVLEIVKTVVAGANADCPAYADGAPGLGAALGVVAGDTVTYCISVTNSSGSNATNVTISDPMAPASFDGLVGDLAVGEFATRSFELVVAIDTAPINTASVGGDGPNGPVAPTTDQAVIAPRLPLDPVLEIVKTVLAGANATCPAYVDGEAGIGTALPVLFGDSVTYCISVTNSSGTDASNVVISDPMAPASFDGVIGDLAVGEFATRSFTLEIDAQTEEVNTATVNGDGPNGAVTPRSDQARILSDAQPDPILQIVKTVVAGPAGACPSFADGVQRVGPLLPTTFGDTVTYCLTVTNIGARPATNVVITDQQAPATFDGAVGTLDPNTEQTRSFDLVIDAQTPTVNTAQVDGEGPNGAVAPDTDQAGIDPSDAPLPRLDIIKTVVPGPAGNCPDFDNGIVGVGPALSVLFGDTVTYCISVANRSDVDANSVSISDVQAPASFDRAIGDLAGRAEVTRSYDIEVTTTTETANTALVSGRGPDGRPVPGDSDTALIAPTLRPEPVLDIVKTVVAGPAAACPAFDDGVAGPGPALDLVIGDTATYCLTVKNTGLGDASAVVISDPQAPAGFDGVVGDVAAGAEVTRSFDIEVASDTPLVNTATVNGEGPSGALAPETDSARIAVALLPNLAIVKTVVAGPAGMCPAFADGVSGPGTALDVIVGDTATYCLTVKNIGLGDASAVVISDPQAPAGFDGAVGDLAAGTEVTRSFDIDVTLNTPAVNTATVDGQGPNGALPPVTDTALVAVAGLPALVIVKTVLPGPAATCPTFADGIAGPGTALDVIVGDTATYCLTVRNAGLGDASAVAISDPQAPAGFDGVVGVLAAGAEVTRSFDIEVVSDTPTVNTATVAGEGPNGAIPPVTDTALITVVELPNLAIVKTSVAGPAGVCPAFDDGVAGPGTALDVIVGDTATYCLTVKNIGLGDASAVLISDPQAPASFNGVVGVLAAGAEVTRSFDLEVASDTPTVNTATVAGDGPNGALPPVTDTALITVVELPNLTIVKTAVAGPAGVCPSFDDGIIGRGTGLELTFGDTVTYCVSVRNVGLGAATDVKIADPQAPGDIIVGDLGPGATFDDSYDVDVTDGTPLINVATVTGEGPAGPINDSDEAEIVPTDQLIPSIRLDNTVVKNDQDCADAQETIDEYLVGLPAAPVKWCFVVTNTGNTALTTIVLDDENVGLAGIDVLAEHGDGAASLAPGESIMFSLDDVFPAIGTISRASVLATPSEADGTPIATLADVTASNDAVVESTSVDLQKLVQTDPDGDCDGATEDGQVNLGDTVIWCFTVTNTGGVDVRVTEVNDSVLDVQIPIPEADQVLETGESVSVSYETEIQFTIANQADIVGTPVDDDGDPIPGAPAPEDDDETTVRALSADLSIVKTNSNAGPLDRGESLTYTLVVANDGPDPAQDVVVVDTLPSGISYDVLPVLDGWSCELDGDNAQEMTCTKATELAVDATATLTYTAKADADAARSTTFTNVAEVTSSTPDPDTTNNTDDSSTRTPAPPVTFPDPPPPLDPPPPPPEPDEILELVITGSSSRAMVVVSTALLGLGGMLIVASRRRRDDLLERDLE